MPSDSKPHPTVTAGLAKRLQASEQRFRHFIETAADWYWESDDRHRLTYLSERHETITGVAPSQGLGTTYAALWAAHALEPSQLEAISAALHLQRPFAQLELRWKHPNGTLRVLQLCGRPAFDARGTFLGFHGSGRDVTEAIETERHWRDTRTTLEQAIAARTSELAKANQRLHAEILEHKRTHSEMRAFVESAPDATIIVDRTGNIRVLNAQAERLFGYTREELRGQAVERLIPERFAGLHCKHRKEYFADATPRPMGAGSDFHGITKDGEEFPVEVSLSPIVTDRETLVAAAIRNITQRKRAEQRLLAAVKEARRANESKSRFLSTASHDLRQPLQTIGIYLDILSRKVSKDIDREIVQPMNESLAAMSSLLNTLLDVSKLEAGAVAPERACFPVQELLHRVYADTAPHAKEKGLAIRLVQSSQLVYSDPVLLERIVRNFASNAVRYTQAGRILIGCRRRAQGLRIEVWDTGIGIARNELEQVFDEFVQLDNEARTRDKGLGLGLAIVKHAARLLGHDIDVSSVPGKGSMFAVQVPLTEERSLEAENASDLERDTADGVTGATILFVEDDPAIDEALTMLLELNGYHVARSSNVADAMQQIRQADLRPDLILADFRLPGGKTGIDLIQDAREYLGASVPAIVVTGDTSPDQLAHSRRLGCQVLHKPVASGRLLIAVRQLTAKHSGSVSKAKPDT